MASYTVLHHFMIGMTWFICVSFTIIAEEAYKLSKREDYER